MKIEEMKKKRYQFLHKLYDLAGCDSTKLIEVYKVGDELGFDRGLTDNIAQFLKDEGMIKFETFAPGDFGYTISITHFGIRQVEEDLK